MMNFRQFPVLFLFLLLIFLNDGLSHPQVQIGPSFTIPVEGARYEYGSADDISADTHPSVDSKVKSIQSVLPLGKKWALNLNGWSTVEARMIKKTVIVEGVKIKIEINPNSDYLLRTQIKKLNANGEFDTIFTGNNDTGWYVNHVGAFNLTSNVFASHICKNKFDLRKYEVEAKADITNTNPNPDENADASIAW